MKNRRRLQKIYATKNSFGYFWYPNIYGIRTLSGTEWLCQWITGERAAPDFKNSIPDSTSKVKEVIVVDVDVHAWGAKATNRL